MAKNAKSEKIEHNLQVMSNPVCADAVAVWCSCGKVLEASRARGMTDKELLQRGRAYHSQHAKRAFLKS